MRSAGLALVLTACIGDTGTVGDAQDARDANVEVAPGEPKLMVLTPAIDFGRVARGDMDTRAVTIANGGSATLVVTPVIDGAVGFTVARDPITLAPTEAASIAVQFVAADLEPAHAELVLDALRVPLRANDGACAVASPPSLDFGALAAGTDKHLDFVISACAGPTLHIDQVGLLDDGDGAFTLSHQENRVRVAFQPKRGVYYAGVVRVTSNALEGVLDVPLRGLGRSGPCPTAAIVCEGVEDGAEVTSETTLHCSGASSSGSAPVSEYLWWLDGTQLPARTVDVAIVLEPGAHVLTLEVVDATGARSCASDAFAVEAVQPPLWRIEVSATTPGDFDDGSTADLDLHLLHRDASDWFDARFDAYFGNPNPNWDSPNRDDDPVVRSSVGLIEAIDLPGVGPGPDYTVGVHYRDDAGQGPAYATVRLYRAGFMVFEGSRALAEDDLWEVCHFGPPDVLPQ